jgi:hypothetical protein
MNAASAFVAAYIPVFFTILIFVGVVFGLVVASVQLSGAAVHRGSLAQKRLAVFWSRWRARRRRR